MDPTTGTSEPIKHCPSCHAGFTLDALIRSRDIVPIGMQFFDESFSLNQYYFNHVCAGCRTTFTVPVGEFLTEIREPIPSAVLAGTAACEHHCVHLDDLRSCSQPCAYAPFRRFLVDVLFLGRAKRAD